MARQVFFSFHFDNDYWRTQTVRNINALSGQKIVSSNDWEEVKQNGDPAVRRWIDGQLERKSCLVVLVGEKTAQRKWVKYEIEKAWNAGKGVLGIHINKLKDKDGNASSKGENPFSQFSLDGGGKMSDHAPMKTPTGSTSKETYQTIADNIEAWIEEAISAR
jgi:hypothetical protein